MFVCVVSNLIVSGPCSHDSMFETASVDIAGPKWPVNAEGLTSVWTLCWPTNTSLHPTLTMFGKGLLWKLIAYVVTTA